MIIAIKVMIITIKVTNLNKTSEFNEDENKFAMRNKTLKVKVKVEMIVKAKVIKL